jgi:hypothetical protein
MTATGQTWESGYSEYFYSTRRQGHANITYNAFRIPVTSLNGLVDTINAIKTSVVKGARTNEEGVQVVREAFNEYRRASEQWLSSSPLTHHVDVSGHGGLAAQSIQNTRNHGGRINGVFLNGVRTLDIIRESPHLRDKSQGYLKSATEVAGIPKPLQ